MGATGLGQERPRILGRYHAGGRSGIGRQLASSARLRRRGLTLAWWPPTSTSYRSGRSSSASRPLAGCWSPSRARRPDRRGRRVLGAPEESVRLVATLASSSTIGQFEARKPAGPASGRATGRWWAIGALIHGSASARRIRCWSAWLPGLWFWARVSDPERGRSSCWRLSARHRRSGWRRCTTGLRPGPPRCSATLGALLALAGLSPASPSITRRLCDAGRRAEGVAVAGGMAVAAAAWRPVDAPGRAARCLGPSPWPLWDGGLGHRRRTSLDARRPDSRGTRVGCYILVAVGVACSAPCRQPGCPHRTGDGALVVFTTLQEPSRCSPRSSRAPAVRAPRPGVPRDRLLFDPAGAGIARRPEPSRSSVNLVRLVGRRPGPRHVGARSPRAARAQDREDYLMRVGAGGPDRPVPGCTSPSLPRLQDRAVRGGPAGGRERRPLFMPLVEEDGSSRRLPPLAAPPPYMASTTPSGTPGSCGRSWLSPDPRQLSGASPGGRRRRSLRALTAGVARRSSPSW